MFRIGEFSQLGQVSVRMLRHYDNLGLLKPAKVDRFTDYRYYTIEQLPRLQRILALKDLGLSLEQIVSLLDNELSPEQLRSMLLLKQAELAQQLEDTRSRLNRVVARLRQIEQEEQPYGYDVTLKSVNYAEIASIRQLVPTIEDMGTYRHQASNLLYEWLEAQKLTPKGAEIVLYHLAEYSEVDIDMEFGIILDESIEVRSLKQFLPQSPVKIRELTSVSQMASLVHSGMLQDIAQGITALYQWIGTNNLIPVGAFREIHLFGKETDRVLDEPVVVELQIPVTSKRSHL
ncbi:MerR family transcriptional regulator [Merismopedia glauca]|uniref:MerR family transcriptional regulator n=1 Tax=Merismopedia glauca CCAP 1448/3 TaxID=1296344 RepID=A0A2T1C6R8_9CYAN|nr:helix-turn-helix domain-containing protein [Merismopedia glauca]PSB03936.1 MerR family transcriptional regulator [Merismopedia glauca CCAP 1448/3]